MAKRPLVLVEWRDAHSPTISRWVDFEEATEPDGAILCRSVGWLLRRTRKVLTLAPHISGESQGIVPYHLGVMSIPAGAVVKVRRLKE